MARKSAKSRRLKRPEKGAQRADTKPLARGGAAIVPEVEELPVAEPDELVSPPEEHETGEAIEAASAAGESAAAEGEERGAIVRVDPLSRYLAEIRRFPLLSREEESEIARRYDRERDPADAYRLVTANLRLVVKISLEFARATRNVLDLIQEGNIGLMEAVKNFDPYRGIRFPSYAVWWVRAYIYRYLINNWRLVKIGTTQAQRKLFFNLRKETERLEALGFTPTPKLLASRIGVKETEVREMQERLGQSEVSLDQPAGAYNDDTRLIDVLPDAANNPEDEAARAEWRTFARDQVERFEATLKDKELEIFRSRLLAENPPTLQEIGARHGISRERVRQIETRLKQRLKEFIKSHAADVEGSQTS
jgi:RNA polymerase sigma-32 factor